MELTDSRDPSVRHHNFRDVVVWLEPANGAPAGRIPPHRYVMEQKDKHFKPHVLAIPVGAAVDFPNHDPIFHNVFSLSGPQPFDLGLYRAGESRPRTFTTPGTYRVFCNIHPQMTASATTNRQ